MRPLENGDLLNSKLFCLIRALEIVFSSLLTDFPGNKSEACLTISTLLNVVNLYISGFMKMVLKNCTPHTLISP